MTRVLMTGAGGRIGQVLRENLRAGYPQLRLFVRDPVYDVRPSEQLIIGHLRELDRMQEAMEGVDVVVHLAGIPDEATFSEILETNIVGTYHVFEAAKRSRVRRVVFASSNHATGFYPVSTIITPDVPVRPDTYYGVSKVCGEALGRLYHDKWGLEVVCLRIGSFRAKPEDARQLSTWLSHRDAIKLVRKSIDAPDVGFTIVYGVSANTRAWWDNGAELRESDTSLRTTRSGTPLRCNR